MRDMCTSVLENERVAAYFPGVRSGLDLDPRTRLRTYARGFLLLHGQRSGAVSRSKTQNETEAFHLLLELGVGHIVQLLRSTNLNFRVGKIREMLNSISNPVK